MIKVFYNQFTLLLLFLALPTLGLSNGQDIEILKKEVTTLPPSIKKINVLNELGEKLFKEDYELAQKYNQQALNLAKQINYQEGIGEATRNLGLINLKAGVIDQSIQLLEEALNIAQQNKFSSLEARALWSLGYYWQRSGDYSKSLEYVLAAKVLADELKDNYWSTNCHIQLGWTYHEKGNDEKAEFHFKQGLLQSESHPRLLPEALYSMAGFYLNKNSNFNLAYNHLHRGLKIAKENKLPRHLAQLQTLIGGLYSRLGEEKKAKFYYLKTLEFFKSAKLYANLSWLYGELGNIAIQEEAYDLALGYFNSALNIQDKVDNKDYESSIFCSIGTIYYKRDKNYSKALDFYYRALAIANKLGSQSSKATIELSIGFAYNDLEEYEKAIHWCEKSLTRTSISLETSKQAYEGLAKAYSKLGQFKVAFDYQEQFNILKDSVHKEELSVQINNLEFRENYEKELTAIKQKQALEKEQSKTRTAWIIGGISLLFMAAILFLSNANIKRTAQKNQLVALAKLRKELIANVSHDLRTPIAVMQGYVETLLMKINSSTVEEREKYLNIILNSSERLSLLIGQLFEFSKLETQQIQPQKTPFQIHELLRSSLEEYQVLADKKGVQLEMDCPNCESVVYADISLIERVIQNLMDNALKFTPEKGKIQVSIVNRDKKVEVSIADTGGGITKEQQAKIFNRHEKAKNSKGAGLGLAIVKKIVELHEGVISVKSELGKGTSFIFSLPAYE